MIESLLSNPTKTMNISAIGQLLLATKSPGFISFTAGVPAKDSFLISEIAEEAQQVILKEGSSLLSYNATEGDAALRHVLAQRCTRLYNFQAQADEVVITTGSTQCIDLCSRAFLNAGDIVAVEEPTYIDAMNTFRYNGAILQGISCDDEGMDLSHLESVLKSGVKMIYVIPDFQNPTGRRWSLVRRQAFMELIAQYPVVVLEDNPYGELFYDDTRYPSLKSLDTKGQVLYLCSMSKIFCPGLRLGWIVAPKTVVGSLIGIKEKCDLHSGSLEQAILRNILQTPMFDNHVEALRMRYKERWEALVTGLRQYMPDVDFTVPQGGFFVWVKLPEGITDMQVLEQALQAKVAFIPGYSFYTQEQNHQYIRLAFPGLDTDTIHKGLQRLAQALETVKKGDL